MFINNAIQNANLVQPIKNENFVTRELYQEAYRYAMRKLLGVDDIDRALSKLRKEDISEDALAFAMPSKESYFIASFLRPLRNTIDAESIYENAIRYEFRSNLYNL